MAQPVQHVALPADLEEWRPAIEMWASASPEARARVAAHTSPVDLAALVTVLERAGLDASVLRPRARRGQLLLERVPQADYCQLLDCLGVLPDHSCSRDDVRNAGLARGLETDYDILASTVQCAEQHGHTSTRALVGPPPSPPPAAPPAPIVPATRGYAHRQSPRRARRSRRRSQRWRPFPVPRSGRYSSGYWW